MPTEFIEISSIETSNRQRKIFDEGALLDLAEGIEQHELLHAPVLLGDSSILVAGERRLRAMEILHRRGTPFTYLGELVPPGYTPIVRASDRDEISLKEAELAENLLRKDLTWQERSSAEKELHDLRIAQTKGAQTLRDTAKEIKREEPSRTDIRNLSEDLLLARHLDDPEILKTKDRRAAVRKVLQKEQSIKRAKMMEQFKLGDIKASPHQLFLGDFRQVLGVYEGELFDLLLTDPPYGVEASGFNDQFTIAHDYVDSSEDWEDLMFALARRSHALTKPKAHAFVFCDIRKWAKLSRLFSDAGWTPWPRPLIWDKGSLGALPKPKHGPRLCYEAIMFAAKGDKEVLKTGRDVLDIPNQAKTHHGAEKPVPLYIELIERSAEAGSLLLDPFAGSGTIFPAATRAGCKALGIEIKEEFYNICLERIDE